MSLIWSPAFCLFVNYLSSLDASFPKYSLIKQFVVVSLFFVLYSFHPGCCMYMQELTLHSESTRPAGGPVSLMELHFDDEDDSENVFEENQSPDGLDAAAVSNELCQAPTESGPTGDTAWDTGVYVGVSSIKKCHTSKCTILVSKQCTG